MRRQPCQILNGGLLMAWFGAREGGELVGPRLGLVLRLPLLVGHAIDMRAAVLLRERKPALVCRILQPVREAVAAEPRQVHEVDVLDVGTLPQMLRQSAERRGLQLRSGLVVEMVHRMRSGTARRSISYTRPATLCGAA